MTNPEEQQEEKIYEEDHFSIANTKRSGITPLLRKRLLRKTDGVINRLVDYQVLKGKSAQVTELEISNVCLLANDAFMDSPVCLEINLNKGLYIIGDLFGQYGDLLRIFHVLGHPPNSRYLFLGNYIDRGLQSVELICLLLAYKVRYPHNIYLLRGNHECKLVSKSYGFYDECCNKYNSRLFKTITSTFEYMPVVAILESQIFCTHSGLSPSIMYSTLKSQKDLIDYLNRSIQRPCSVSSSTLVSHFLWSDSDPEINLWDQNPAGLGYLYGKEVVDDFCRRFEFDQIIRSNELVENGYEFYPDPRLLTIFSAPHFCGKFRNNGGIVQLKKCVKDLEIKARMYLVKPIYRLRNKMTGRMNVIIEKSVNTNEKIETKDSG